MDNIDPEILAKMKAQQPRIDALAKAMAGDLTAEQLAQPASKRLVHLLIADLVVVMRDGLIKQVKDLQARVVELEAGGVKYCGTWQRALPYRKGTVATSGGSMWIALRDTVEGEQPGKALDAWQLSAKDAKPTKRVKANGRRQA
ncbi:transposase [Mesorhizobium sp. M0060]|uniref:transposase n=1 Tax=Mesorhizobium sp. M0060 TaxID=2956866 RepID=UPI0033396040